MRNEKLHTHSRVMNARMRSRRLQGPGVSLAHVLTALKSTASVQHFSLKSKKQIIICPNRTSYRNIQIISNGKNIIQSGRSPQIDILYVVINNSSK